ncbi:hypothetical protein [Paraclostridium bifermentans]|uniref:hypothetical protein n=1 Tax=Paraclostridium bifermentans TaxID=1490 RepID=UPI00387B7523
MSFGINQDKIETILEKNNIKSGENISVDNIKNAISEIVNENNKEIEHYLSHEYPEFINRQLALMIKRRR